MTERILVERADGVARVRLNRADKHNAVDRGMFEALIDIGGTLADDRSLRAVVLEGQGENFCAGIDVSVFAAGKDGFDPQTMQARADSPANFYQSAAYVWRELPVPVIAALKGVVFGAGLQIALGADLRVCHPRAKLSVMETKWGIIPDMGITTTLPSLMPLDKALSLTLTGRVINGADAAELGLVTQLSEDPEADAMRLAQEVAGRSPDAVRAAKRLLKTAWADRDADLLKLEAALQMQVMAAPNQQEAVSANMERREPNFSDAAV